MLDPSWHPDYEPGGEFTAFIPGEIFTINAERKLHYHARANLVQPLRHAAMIIARNWLRNGGSKFTTQVAVTFLPVQSPRGPAADTANHLPACKAVLDGCVDAGIIPDDTPEWVVSQCFLPPTRAKQTGINITIAEDQW